MKSPSKIRRKYFNHLLRFSRRAVVPLLLFLLLFKPANTLAAFTDADIYSSPVVPGSSLQSFEPQKFTGAFTYDYQISTPPGRNGLQPDLRLNYNSQFTDPLSPVGYGWSLSLPYIQRVNKTGIENLYNSNTFYSSLDGLLGTTTASTTIYRARSDNGLFISYSFNGTSWTATDKNGLTYTFGINSSARISDPANATHTYRWMLEEVRDKNNNYIKYQYILSEGQVYPSSILYTGNGVTDGPFEVSFALQTRPDSATTTYPGFGIAIKKRINQATVKISGTTRHIYDFVYSTSQDSNRSLLTSITETGKDELGVSTILPDTIFSYTQFGTSTSQGVYTGVSNNASQFVLDQNRAFIPIDVNADSFVDIIYVPNVANNGVATVYLNNTDGTGWTASSTWQVPSGLVFIGSTGFTVGDFNGDGYPDLFQDLGLTLKNPAPKFYINNKTTGWTLDTSYAAPSSYRLTFLSNCGFTAGDINGDGLSDIVATIFDSSHSPSKFNEVIINKGNGTWDNGSWTLSGVDLGRSGSPKIQLGQILDINGDGLADAISAASTANVHVFLNDGKSTMVEQATTTWSIPPNNTWDLATALVDLNGDKLPDLIQRSSNIFGNGNSGIFYQKGDGTGWKTTTNTTLGYDSGYSGNGLTIFTQDSDTNGIPNLLTINQFGGTYGGPDGAMADLLETITTSQGATTEVTYRQTSSYRDAADKLANPLQPYEFETVRYITTSDGFGTVATTTYSYEGAKNYYSNPYDREVSGFAQTTEVDVSGNLTKTFYHQGDTSDTSHGEYSDSRAKIGKSYRTEEYDDSGNLYRKTINKWDSADLGNGNTFVKLAQSVVSNYDGDSDHRDSAETYTYDNLSGNQTQRVMYGEVTGSDDGSFTDTGSDKRTLTTTFASSTPTGISKPSDEVITDQSGVKVAQTRHYYDNLSLGSIGNGNETKTERWKTGTAYASTTQVFNTFGLVTQSRDPRNNLTTYSFDSLNLYPATTTNPASHIVGKYYDYAYGKPKLTIDPNNRQFSTTYDGLGRPLTEKQPDITTPTTLVTKKTYSYVDTVGSRRTLETSSLDSTNSTLIYTYFDGLNRKIQSRKEAESGGQYAVRDFKYNKLGLLEKESLPYFSSGLSRTSATGNSNLYTSYIYDALDRVTEERTSVGNTDTSYDQWTTTVVDPEESFKDFTYDAYGNLVQVVENGNYTTAYQYDTKNNLTKITDADGNIRNFTYDGLSRRLTAQDLHDTADATYGTWSYAYDDAGNLTSQTDPKSQVVNLTYDNLNRPLTEDFTGLAGTEVTYGYDTCAEGKSHLCSATTTAVTTVYTYNARGLLASEKETINGVGYTSSYTYDRLGNYLIVTYPDNSQVQYTYNSAGLLETIDQKESGGSFVPLVTEYNYGPTEKVTFKLLANGVGTTYTYDANELYRLRNILTVASSSGGGGILSFSLDPYGDLASLVEHSNYAQLSLNPMDLAGDPILNPTNETTTPQIIPPDNSPSQQPPPTSDVTDVASTSVENSNGNPPIDPNISQLPEVVPEQVPEVVEIATTSDAKPPVEVTPPSDPQENLLIKPDVNSTDLYSITFKNSLPSEGVAKVMVSKQHPEVHLMKWNGEVDLGVSYPPVVATGTQALNSDKVEWKGSTEEVHAYPLSAKEGMEGGGFEIEVYLKERPASNLFDFAITGTENLDFFYQPELTKEEIDEGVTRPENVIDSYAVYIKDKKDYVLGQTNYSTGKAFHIYRPKAIDANGNEVWGSLSYKEGVLTVSIPSSFLDTAVYPVVVDPTIGYTTIGATGISGTAANYLRGGSIATTTESGTVTSVSFYVSGMSANMKAVVTDSSLNIVSNGVSGSVAVNTTAGWYTPTYAASSSPIISASQVYYLATIISTTSPTFTYRYDTVADFKRLSDSSNNYTNPTNPTDAVITSSNRVSIYATYINDPQPPSSPTSLFTEGQVNPTNVSDVTPEFSAIYNDANENDVTDYYQIQVATSTAFTSVLWDSSKLSLSSSTSVALRSPDISYAGPSLVASTTYYWRIKFWDQANTEGAWSTGTSSFMLGTGTNSSTITDSFECMSDGSMDMSCTNLWKQASISTDDGDWQAETDVTVSANTGPDEGSDGTVFIYTEASDTFSCDSVAPDQKECTIEADILNGADGTIVFDYHMFGTNIGTLDLDAYNGTSWTNLWTKSGNQGNQWNTATSTWSSTNNYTHLRFRVHAQTGFAADVGLDNIRVTTITGGSPPPPPASNIIQNLTITYSPTGNITQVSENAGVGTGKIVVFDYDEYYRLTFASTTAASSTPFKQTFTYTPIGNISSSTPAGAYVYGETGYTNPNAPTSVGGIALSYDNDGNLTAYGSKSYTWDYRNRLATSSVGTATTSYSYDYQNQRVKKVTGSNTSLYPNIYFSKEGTTTTKYIYANGELIATKLGNGVSTTTQYSHADWLGSTNAVTDSVGSVVQILDYYPYGAKRISTGTDVSQREYIGQIEDPESGMNYLNARYYEGSRGQFLSQDPVFWEVGQTPDGQRALMDPQLQNSYSYARNNPIVNKDPDGRIIPVILAAYGIASFAIDAYDLALTNTNVSVPFTNVRVGYADQFSADDKQISQNKFAYDVVSSIAGGGLSKAGNLALDSLQAALDTLEKVTGKAYSEAIFRRNNASKNGDVKVQGASVQGTGQSNSRSSTQNTARSGGMNSSSLSPATLRSIQSQINSIQKELNKLQKQQSSKKKP